MSVEASQTVVRLFAATRRRHYSRSAEIKQACLCTRLLVMFPDCSQTVPKGFKIGVFPRVLGRFG
jgi:hypothetical protein